MNTHRAYLATDTALTMYARSDSAVRDLSGASVLKAYLYPYGSSLKVDETGITATGSSVGLISFTVTDTYADANLKAGLFRLVVEADDVNVYDGLLEVV